MICTECRPLLEAFHDRELDARAGAGVEQHLSTCSTCRAELDRLRSLSELVKKQAARYAPPAALEHRLASAIAQGGRPARSLWRPRSIFGLSAAAAVLALVMFSQVGRRSGGERLVDEAIAAHIRSLQVDHLIDVESSDRHTVKPWFQGKVNFSVDVRDWSDRGIALVGGRLDFLDEVSTAALVYRIRNHPVNVFVRPAQGVPDREVSKSRLRGYAALRWTSNGMDYVVVSDVDEADLTRLVELLRAG